MSVNYSQVSQTIRLALLYFIIVFAVGFVLGSIRVMFMVPAIGERWAELLEMPLMLLAITYTAKYLVYTYSMQIGLKGWLYIGIFALIFLLAVEFTVVLGLRDISLSEYFHSKDNVTGSAYLISLIIFMLMPSYIYKRYK